MQYADIYEFAHGRDSHFVVFRAIHHYKWKEITVEMITIDNIHKMNCFKKFKYTGDICVSMLRNM